MRPIKGIFTPHKSPRFTNKYFGRYERERGSYAELCRQCGYPLGEHSGVDCCPGQNGFMHEPRMSPQFYSEKLNKNTKTI